jgi:hypothetical protein
MTAYHQAYAKLAAYVLAFIDDREWDSAGCTMSIFNKMATGTQWLSNKNNLDKLGGFSKNPTAIWDGLDSAIFLRDSLLKATGDRIWSLTFTLHPEGKFKIAYDYTKPDGYDEQS